MAAIRVAVVGAGASGIVAAKVFLERSDLFSVIVFEQTRHIGGTWFYVDQVGNDESGIPIHSSMYHNLRSVFSRVERTSVPFSFRANLPKEIMSIPHFPFCSSLQSFPSHEDIVQYIEEYAEAFHLRQSIKLRHLVEHVSPCHDSTGAFLHWAVRVRDLSSGTTIEDTYDVVLVCNGHYAVPKVPHLDGMETFRGEVLHSHDYRHPERFAGKRVAILGAANSGQDIALDMAQLVNKVGHVEGVSGICAQVYLCHDNPQLLCKDMPTNVIQKLGVARLSDNKVRFRDGTEEQVDCFMFATGYEFSFPFLDASCQIRVQDHRVTPLFKHMVNIEYPSMFFIGIPIVALPFITFHHQTLFARSLLTGKAKLPSKEEMLADEQRDYEWRLQRGMPHKYAHKMDFLQFKYHSSLAAMAGVAPPPKVLEDIWMEVYRCRSEFVIGYKSDEYRIIDEETYAKQDGDHPAMGESYEGFLSKFMSDPVYKDRDSYPQ